MNSLNALQNLVIVAHFLTIKTIESNYYMLKKQTAGKNIKLCEWRNRLNF